MRKLRSKEAEALGPQIGQLGGGNGSPMTRTSAHFFLTISHFLNMRGQKEDRRHFNTFLLHILYKTYNNIIKPPEGGNLLF